MSLKLSHETLAEAHYLGIGLAPRAEIGTTLGAAHRQCRKRILECLLEGKELHDTEIHAAVETDTSLVRSDGTVHLNAETAVDPDLTGIVHPRNPENDDSFRFSHSFHNLLVKEMRGGFQYGCHAFQNFFYRLVELRLARVLDDQVVHETGDIPFSECRHNVNC